MKKIDRFLLFFVSLGVWSIVSVLILKPSYLSAERHTANHVHRFEEIRFEQHTLMNAFNDIVKALSKHEKISRQIQNPHREGFFI